MKRAPSLVILSCLVACAVTAQARLAHAQADEENPPEFVGQKPLSFTEAITVATQRNLRLLINSMEREIAELRATEARRPYAPVIFLEPEVSTSQNLLIDPPRRTTGVDVSGGVRWANRWGTTLDVRALTTPWYTGFTPLPLTQVQASLGQSLLRDGWNDSTLLDRIDLGVALLNALLVDVERAYWTLAYAQADITIKERSRDRAQQQFDDTKENIRRGLLAPGEIYVVEENLVIFEEQLLRSREQVRLAQLDLARLLQMPEQTELRATDSLDQPQLELPRLADALDVALRTNPAVRAERIALEQAQVQLAFDRNQSRPVLDLGASLSLNGLSENQADAWGETFSAQNPALRVGLTFEVPLVGAPYRARVSRAELERRQQLEELKQTETDVTFTVRELATQLTTRIKALDFAIRRIELAEQKLATEQEKYQRGLATLTDVVRFQRDLDGARISERRARLDVITLRARLAEAQGILYRRAGVEVQ